MLTILVVLALLAASVGGLYLLLKSMGEDGVEAAAPGSCKSGKCGVQPQRPAGDAAQPVNEQYIQVDEIKRKDALSNNQLL
jgi:hypothetical protein